MQEQCQSLDCNKPPIFRVKVHKYKNFYLPISTNLSDIGIYSRYYGIA